jgi:hypothetical protein
VHYQELIDRYAAGSDLAEPAVGGKSDEKLDAEPIAGIGKAFARVTLAQLPRSIARSCL